MKIHTPPLAALLLVFFAVSGCTTWQAGDGTTVYADEKSGFSFIQHQGWYRSPYKARGFLTLTKDGPDLQYISMGRRNHKKAFRALEKNSSASDLPQDLANNYIADIKAMLGIDVIEVLENSPAEVGGKPGFYLELAYKSNAGLRYRERVYGAATQHGLYLIEFRAPVLHYFDRDVQEFEETLQTFVINR